jgi:hypothetical protein
MTIPLYQDLLDDICAFTKDATYSLYDIEGQVCLRHVRANQQRIVSPLMSYAAMEPWLEAFLVGLEVGYLTAKRGK